MPDHSYRMQDSFYFSVCTLYFILFISNDILLKKYYFMYIYNDTKKPKEFQRKRYYVQKFSDSLNWAIELLLVKPHAQDQSNKNLIKNVVNWVTELSVSSKVWWFRSLLNAHIKHKRTMFHISDECLLTQFLQPYKRSMTFFR